MTRIGLAVAGLGMTALLTACGGGSDDFSDQSGADIAKAAKKAMKGLDAVKVAGTITTDGQEISIDVQTNDQGDCTGSLGVGDGTAELVGKGGDVWFRPDEAFWRASAPDSADQVIAAVGDKWVVAPADGSFGEFCDIDDLLDELISDDDSEDDSYSTRKVEEVDGEDAVPVDQKDDDGDSTGYVRVDEPHYLVKVEKTKGDDTGSVTFSEFDEDFDVEVPAEGDVIDLANLSG